MRSILSSSFPLFAVHAFAQAGTLDPTFAESGVRILQTGTGVEMARDVAHLPDNSIVVCGMASHDSLWHGIIAHVYENGDLDTTFGAGGFAWMPALGDVDLRSIAVASDGGIIVAGYAIPEFTAIPLLAKLLPDGEFDPAFGVDGVVLADATDNWAMLFDLVIRPDGRMVACGYTSDDNTVDNGMLLAFLPDGTPDTGFSGDGLLVNTAFTTDDVLDALTLTIDGGVAAAGQVNIDGATKTVLLRTYPDGGLDPSFGDNGVALLPVSTDEHWARGIAADAERLLVSGSIQHGQTDRSAYVAACLADGSLDLSFGQNGLTVIDTLGYCTAWAIGIQADGKPVIAGSATTFPDRHVLLARLAPDGTMDGSFGSDGIVITTVAPEIDQADALSIGPDGRIVVAGIAEGDNFDMLVLRYLNDGCAVFPFISPEGVILCPNSTGELTTSTFDTYQWYKNGVEIPGFTNQTLSVNAADDVGSWFKVRTTIDTCFGFSDSVLVDGYAFLPPVVINEGDTPNLIGDNGEQIYCQGDDPLLVLSAPYDTNVQWSVNGEPIPGANDTLYAVPGSGSYTVEGAPSVCPDFIQNPGVAVVMDFHPYVQPTIYQTGILLCPQPEGLSSQWYYNGQPVAGFEQCVIPIDAGNYTVFVDYGDSCSVLSAPFYLVGLDEYARADMKASPVPTNDRVTITWAEGGPLPDWRVIDVTGRIVRSGTKATSPLAIDLGALDVGRYRFLSGDGRSLPLVVTH